MSCGQLGCGTVFKLAASGSAFAETQLFARLNEGDRPFVDERMSEEIPPESERSMPAGKPASSEEALWSHMWVQFAAALMLYVFYAWSAPQGPRGGSAIGLFFGVVGFGFMIYAAALGARKRPKVRKVRGPLTKIARGKPRISREYGL